MLDKVIPEELAAKLQHSQQDSSLNDYVVVFMCYHLSSIMEFKNEDLPITINQIIPPETK